MVLTCSVLFCLLLYVLPPPGVIEACAERGDTQGALETLQMMRGAAATAATATATVGVCPRPSYRSYLAALRACSRASPPPPPTPTPPAVAVAAAATVAPAGGVGAGDGAADASRGVAGGEARANGGVHVCGDWRASNEVLGMMWEDDAARMAEGKAAVPGRLGPPEEGRGGGLVDV